VSVLGKLSPVRVEGARRRAPDFNASRQALTFAVHNLMLHCGKAAGPKSGRADL
jgi:hypothetical protein